MEDSTNDVGLDIAELTRRLAAFRDDRDWRQFHTVKNLIVSLAIEAAELMEITQWKSDAEVEAAVSQPATKARLGEECADVFLYLLMLAERADIDLLKAAAAKIAVNGARYPAATSRGNARKYNEL